MIPQTTTFLHRSEFTLGILAGGSGRRAGRRDKGLLVTGGRTLIEKMLTEGSNEFAETIACCRENHWFYSMFADRVFSDSRSDEGPLWGITNLLGATETEFLAVLPCDQKTLPREWLDRLTEAMGADDMGVFASDGGRHTPCGVLRRDAGVVLEEALKQGHRSLRVLFDDLGFKVAEIPSIGDDVDTISKLQSD